MSNSLLCVRELRLIQKVGRGIVLTGLFGVETLVSTSALVTKGDWLQSVSLDDDNRRRIFGDGSGVPLGTECLKELATEENKRKLRTFVYKYGLNPEIEGIKIDF